MSRPLDAVTGTILVVDDDAAVVTVTQYMLEALGFRVLTARDGEQAVTTFRDRQDVVDLVVLDMVMPRIGGKETFERLREIDPAVPVLLSSGYSPEGHVAQVLGQGKSDFLQKPFGIDELSRKVEGLLPTA